jgi:hypothetical protein
MDRWWLSVATRREGLKEQPWFVRFNAYGIVLAVLIFVGALYGATREYAPFTLYNWTNIPKTVCPLEQFETGYVSSVKPGPYSVGHLEGSALLLNEDNRVVESWDFKPIDLKPYPKTQNPSVAIRSAPLEEGTYHFGLDGKVTGRMFWIVPTYQKLDKIGKNNFTVLPLRDERCKGFDYVGAEESSTPTESPT